MIHSGDAHRYHYLAYIYSFDLVHVTQYYRRVSGVQALVPNTEELYISKFVNIAETSKNKANYYKDNLLTVIALMSKGITLITLL